MIDVDDELDWNALAALVADEWWHNHKGKEWVTTHPHPISASSSKLCGLAKFLNDPWDEKRKYLVDISNPKIRNWLTALNGPNAHTLFKMLAAQHDE